MRFWNNNKKKCAFCNKENDKEHMDLVVMGKYVCKTCNTKENKSEMKQRAIEQAEALGLPKDFVEKLVNKR